MKYLKVLLLQLLLLLLFVGVCFGSAEVTYYVTESQLNALTEQINNLNSNNNELMSLLDLQTKEYKNLEKNYEQKYNLMEQQQENYQNLLSRSENKNSLYKYGIGLAFAVGLILGVIIMK